MLISSHLNQQFTIDSTQLAGGIVHKAAQTLAMCCEEQSLAPCRELACCLVVQSDFHRDVCHQRYMQISLMPRPFSRKWAGDVK